ncbi:MAG TPA: energy transducer TonB [Pyrinomonadaceae bacterium]|nr:energy transducer TonB [Pyrinomonadaceae bacterium]
MYKRSLLLTTFAFLVCFQTVTAQTPVITEAKMVSRTEPQMPTEAITSGLGGRVSVVVSLDENGSVLSVDNVSGPSWVCPSVMRPDVVALREAARDAAMRSTYEPAKENEKNIPSKLMVEYNFISTAEKITGDLSSDKALKRTTLMGSNDGPPPDYTGPVNVSGTGTSVKAEKAETTNNGPVREKFTIKGDRDYSATPSHTDSSGVGRSLSGGVLNGKAKYLPKPPYPAAARAVRAAGAVSIQVLILEDGSVFSSKPVSGHPLLRMAARNAACGAAFSPTQLDGTPVRVSGVITYNFVP